jgi:hypothetical protein
MAMEMEMENDDDERLGTNEMAGNDQTQETRGSAVESSRAAQ